MTTLTPGPTWSARASRVLHAILGAVLAVAFFSVAAASASASGSERVEGLLAIIPGIVLVGAVWLAFGSLSLGVEGPEVVVRYGVSPFRSRYRLDEIRAVEVDQVRLLQYGGFGYRGSRRFLKRVGIIVRSGEAVRLDLDDGAVVHVTVDDAAGAVALIRELIGRG